MNSKCEENYDKVRSHQRLLEAKSKKTFSNDLMAAEERLRKRKEDQRIEALNAYKRDQ
jgi:hypothetical protein